MTNIIIKIPNWLVYAWLGLALVSSAVTTVDIYYRRKLLRVRRDQGEE